MNPCFKLSLFEGARYVAIGEFIYSLLAISVLVLQLINTFLNGVAVNNENISLSETFITQVLLTHLSLCFINFILSVVLYRGIVTENLQKCRTFLIIATISTIFGFATVIYHGLHLAEIRLSMFNMEFVVSLAYNLYKIYALLVIIAFVRELDKLLQGEDDASANFIPSRYQYQSLDHTNHHEEHGSKETVQHIFFNIPFSARHYISEDRLKIDYDTCIEYEEVASVVKGVLLYPLEGSVGRGIAVKILKSGSRSEKHMTTLTKEAKLMSLIGNHEHILQFLGICCTSSDINRGNVMMIMEEYPARRLDEFLRGSYETGLLNFKNAPTSANQFDKKSNKRSRRLGTVYENYQTNYYDLETFSTLNMLQWAYQLSSAMQYLHSRNIIVGNLQAKSLILFKVSQIKLSNFPLAVELHETKNVIPSISLSRKISWQWTALECLCSTNQGLPTKFNEKSDVWAYGSVLWEIYSMGRAPNMSSTLAEYLDTLSQGNRPSQPEFASEPIFNFMKTCWTENPADRPNFTLVTLFFQQLLSTAMQT